MSVYMTLQVYHHVTDERMKENKFIHGSCGFGIKLCAHTQTQRPSFISNEWKFKFLNFRICECNGLAVSAINNSMHTNVLFIGFP